MSTQKPKILYVDDEVNNLSGFKATFRRDYKVFTAESAQKGLEILEQEDDFKVIISDQRMPEITGVEFLKTVVEKYPEPVRMLLTGYADIEDVILAINEGHVYRYITKPWNEDDMRITINNALDFFDTKNELRIRNQQLEKAYSELEKFVYSASHDMRAPLASISGLVKLVKMENQNPSSEDYLEKIEASINKLDVFIENIIGYYRSAKSEQQLVEIDFNQLVNDNIEIYRYYEGVSEIEFIRNIQQEIPYTGEETRIKIVFNNLLSNAIKYQRADEPNKRIKIDIKTDDKEVTIQIADNGSGIPADNLNDIFSMFYRSTAQNSGSGIGLYIVRETLQKLDGTIEVESTFGEGTTFTVKIPNHN